MDREGGVVVNRKIIYIKPDLYIIMDELYSGDFHTYQQYWNFSEWGKVELSNPQRIQEPKLAGRNQAESPDPTIHKDWSAEAKADFSGGLGTLPVQTAVFTGKAAEAKLL